MTTKTRAFLKWAGGKYKLSEAICERLPQGERLVEPFVGAGSVFLNSDFKRYLLCDINSDLIDLYQCLQHRPQEYIKRAQALFTPKYNDKQVYLDMRAEFNQTTEPFERAVMFLYLNRHGYNGLCRYNKKGGFNVPFGSYKKPYFPEKELLAFAAKAHLAEFRCVSYQQGFDMVDKGDVVYCDPPYAPLSHTANFTSYASAGFSLDDQALLARRARHCAANQGVSVLISNHDTPLTRELYHGAKLDSIQVQRNISQNGRTRGKVPELMALYTPDN
ncbi:Dam family site-specific DNA-(adenine-N6)-methyltransferase [Paraferrimonas sedimenticola]|uniref:Site-specific DNA-methyltransferase (adenine-specific) n=1 Tax=Paraferrimonas sedimenticola TaxID=375674 RepID=A0AA37RXW8_9GAMM|nr:Dam family site-specific DNA-(adenine-N6)-methyltransferase [Paraferrimonas sedimenticola]GLP97521.1 site-specific DNA-methyltransferase (adenine-specific) [Paraferrimonas sedimenticola]